MSHLNSSQRLCIYCRALEPSTEPCPMIQNSSPISDFRTDNPIVGLSKEDADQIRTLQDQPSELCARCAGFDILALFSKSQPLDSHQRYELRDTPAFVNDLNHRIHLGCLSSIFLTPSCPFCRLLYCNLPRNPSSGRTKGGALKYAQRVGETDPEMYLTPARTYLRQFGWETMPDSYKKQHAVVLSLEESCYSKNELFQSTPSPLADASDVEYASLDGPLIAMESRFLGPDRKFLNFRLVANEPDLSEVRQALDDCMQNHTGTCHVEKPEEILKIQVIDVIERVVVPYPAGSEYVALSYVWGGVSPTPGALENRCLPRTIEDAITVTKGLGMRYLWVDALCIDQSPCLTESQMKEKIMQLDMMSTIYGCSILVITAMDGKNGNSGLTGISAARGAQVAETIDGCNLFTTPATDRWEKMRSVWATRAWTKQEDFLSPRSINFTSGQVVFRCNRSGVEEDLDMASLGKKSSELPIHDAVSGSLEGIFTMTAGSSTNKATSTYKNLLVFFSILTDYTNLQMTNENDSLNAFRGLITAFRKQSFPQGFVHGLPLKSHIISLAWIHEGGVVPKRRAKFPTWSWTGWEGGVTLPYKLRLLAEDPSAVVDESHLEPAFLTCNGNEIEIDGWVVDLDIRTEPFSEVFFPGREESIATVREGDSNHNNTLPTGRYTCLIIKRHSEILGSRWAENDKSSVKLKQRDTLFVLAFDQIPHEKQAVRRSLLTIALFAGESSDQIMRRREVVRLI